MIAEKWFENRTAEMIQAATPEEKRHAENRSTSRMIATRTMFCPSCGVCSDLKRMIWVENDSTGMIIPNTVFCGLCERASASEPARAIAERLRKDEGDVISFHCPNKVIEKRLNKALSAERTIEPQIEMELVNQEPRRVVFRFRGKETIGLECLKQARRANPEAVLVTRRLP